MPPEEVVITGVGVVSPIGIGKERFRKSLRLGRSGVGSIRRFDQAHMPVKIGAEVVDFDPKVYVRPRKNLKVMARDSQLGVAACGLACQDAGIAAGAIDPERFGVVLGPTGSAGPCKTARPRIAPASSTAGSISADGPRKGCRSAFRSASSRCCPT